MPETIRTAPREDRVLSGPAITFAIAEELSRLRQEPEWISGKRNSVTVVKTSNLSVVLTAIKKGAPPYADMKLTDRSRCKCSPAPSSSACQASPEDSLPAR
jgi:hypothetical protein